jgi:hypothetical protein
VIKYALKFTQQILANRNILQHHSWEHQLVEFPWFENMVVLANELPHEHVVVVFLILIAFSTSL